MIRRRTDSNRRRSAAAALLLLVLLTTSCLGRSPEVSHFVLGRVEPGGPAAAVDGVSVLVGPVRLPDYLERPQMARLLPSGEVELDETHRWLGGFEENLLRALSSGLARRLGSARVVSHPSQAPFAMDYRVRLHVDELVDFAGQSLRVRIRWALVPSGDPPKPELHVLDESVPLAAPGSEALVAAHEAAIAELVEQIALAIESHGPSEATE